ncbi:MAG: FAD-dependent oxidoreductase, partial [Oscillospiraceae bacterium]|nr:FAD-dependent oxidoreductase [Oscillospiraceae bacterium]
MRVIIVGGVAGGASAAARLRRLDEQAEIIMFERGGFISFANCGLPYYVGGDIEDRDELELQTPESFNDRFNVEARIFSEVIEIDRAVKTVSVKDVKTGEIRKESYDKLILSPGAKAIKPPLDGVNHPKVFTVRTIPDAVGIKEFIDREKPRCAVVIGGGYIGIEMAENLCRAGLSVTVVEMSDHVIASLDYDMACDVHNYLKEKGVTLLLSNGVKAIRDVGGKPSLELRTGQIDADMVIMAAGVAPETGLASAAGLEVNKRGAIIVDETMLTSDENIYAVGDAVEITEFVTGQSGYIPLAGPANRQGRIVADNICGIGSKYKGTQGSAVMKIFDMTVAVTGVTEAAAKAKGLNYDKVFTYSASHAGYYPGGSEMSIKTVFDKTDGRILGAQIVGYDGVDKRCNVLAAAIRAGMKASDLTEMELCYAPPFSSAKDPVNFVGFVIENCLTGKVKQFHWHDVDALPRDGSVTLLDVRTPGEYASGNITGFINIEVDSLREQIGALDK